MSKRKKTAFEESLLRNQHSYIFYRHILTEICLSQFQWNGLPDTVDPRYLELKLFLNGACVYFNDEIIGDMALAVIPGGRLNQYGIPIERTAWSGYNSYSKRLTDADSVIIWNNMMHINSALTCELYARRLWDYDQVCDINVRAQKTPILLIADESERLTMLNVYKDYDGNAPVIYGTKSLNPKSIQAISTGAELVAPKIYDMKAKIWNEALTYLGISNLTVTKREQVNKDEVTRSLGGTYGIRFSRLKPRMEAAEKINKMFGTNITVEVTEDIFNKADETEGEVLGL